MEQEYFMWLVVSICQSPNVFIKTLVLFVENLLLHS